MSVALSVIMFYNLCFRLVEEVKEKCKVEMVNEDVYMSPTLDAFIKSAVLKSRGGDAADFTYDAVSGSVDCVVSLCCFVAPPGAELDRQGINI